MGANGNPPSSNQNGGTHGGSGNPSNGGGGGVAGQGLKHDPGIALDWSSEEQSILEEGLNTHASEPNLIRYAKIAMKLKDKTVRDVAMRCRWMSKKESGKRRKDEHNLAKKSKDKKEKVSDSSTKPASSAAGRPNMPPYPLPVLPMDDDDISFKTIGGPTGDLLEHNAQVLNQISTNITNMQIQDNIALFCKTRDNILAVLKEMSDVPDIMKQMPPLPVKINEELANSILPRNNGSMQ
ncbi:hypothetical protein LUZ61_000531 [Rhynchospora tenuis]|uniref:Myb-like domain-containing protein n=1 Tax=Rhynchospora tenuis TaxID=198213 RepID=A0AAD5ZF66_9POAL|nr:hypothetical protein LUZ61_000531 [Rhynchospora tenuis]